MMDWYLWLKAAHVVMVIAWMAGLLYLPRLFVHHCEAPPGSDLDARFRIMERRLLRAIMNPAMIAVWVLALTMLYFVPDLLLAGWMHVKLTAVLLLTAVHMMLARDRRRFANGENQHSATYFRVLNEVPTVLMILIVVMVIVRPF